MNRTEFMSELEYLLQDIPEEEKAEALAYYRDYLEDAGDENEEQVIREFGSPERVAAIIRSDLSGSLENGGEFTEAGYQDERFKDPNYQVVEHRHLPDVSETGAEGAGNQTDWKEAGKRQGKSPSNDTMVMRFLKVGFLLLAIAVLSPLILGLSGGMLGIAAGILALIVAAIVLVGVLTIAACIVAVSLLVVGGGLLITQPWGGILVLGLGIFVLGLAFIGIALSVLVYGTFIPFCIRSVVNAVSSLLHRGRRNQK